MIQRRRKIVLGVVGAYFVLVAGFMLLPIRPTTHELKGILVDVQSGEMVHAQQVTLRDQDGREHTFQVSSEVATNAEHPNTAAHLRQHLIFADPVVVRYRTTASGRVAERIMDAELVSP